MKIDLLDTLREKNPIAFNISNFVTVQDVANGINALGASPIMSEEKNEAEAMVQMANSVTVNLGAFTEAQLNQIDTVTTFANQYDKPIVIDPVAVGAVSYRLERCNELLAQKKVAVIRGNAGEIAALAGVEWNAKGIDAGEGLVIWLILPKSSPRSINARSLKVARPTLSPTETLWSRYLTSLIYSNCTSVPVTCYQVPSDALSGLNPITSRPPKRQPSFLTLLARWSPNRWRNRWLVLLAPN